MSFGSKIASLFGLKKSLDESFYENLEDILIEGDLGAKNAMEISDLVREKKPSDKDELNNIVFENLSNKINSIDLEPTKDDLTLYLFLGVNGVGKTTSLAKLAKYYSEEGNKIVIAAADTFRSAAIDQLEVHAQKLNCRIVKQEHGSDPGAVIFDAISSAISKKDNLILCDTAGRMHNKDDLMKELQKIDKIIKARIKPENYKKILVVDGTTGQNAVSQAQLFNDAVGLDALIVTKLDSASKAGALVQINIPVAYACTGEGYDDIHKFDSKSFITGLLGI